jgi:hypothetical protein
VPATEDTEIVNAPKVEDVLIREELNVGDHRLQAIRLPRHGRVILHLRLAELIGLVGIAGRKDVPRREPAIDGVAEPRCLRRVRISGLLRSPMPDLVVPGANGADSPIADGEGLAIAPTEARAPSGFLAVPDLEGDTVVVARLGVWCLRAARDKAP